MSNDYPNGSAIPKDTPPEHVETARFLTLEGICARHNMTHKEFHKIADQLSEKKLSDILFSFPTGPRYDITLYLVATCR